MKVNKKLVLCFGILFTMLLCANRVYASDPVPFEFEGEENSFISTDDSKLIYLTFDDGPSKVITNKILDILKEKNVKATFFIVGSKIQGKEDVLMRIYKDGHSMGLHTYTHKFNKIYSSHKVFVDEMLKTSDEIYSITGYKPNVIRFPGGSKGHLDKAFLEQLHSYGFKIYDWNVTLSDGIDYNTPSSKLYREGINTHGRVSPLIVLLHCSAENKTTCEALPRIIDFYKEQGYEFAAITEDTKEYIFRMK